MKDRPKDAPDRTPPAWVLSYVPADWADDGADDEARPAFRDGAEWREDRRNARWLVASRAWADGLGIGGLELTVLRHPGRWAARLGFPEHAGGEQS